MIRNPGLIALASLALILVSGCKGGSSGSTFPSEEQQATNDLRNVVAGESLSGDPAAGRSLPDISDPLAQLGMKLFFSRGLGGDLDSSCVTCHHPALGGGDGMSLSIGVGSMDPELLGPGRHHSNAAPGFDGGPTVPRNAPTTFNVALWDRALFHDGRVESLGATPGSNGDDGQGIRTPDTAFGVADAEAGPNLASAQARFPVTSGEEMRGFTYAAGETNAVLRQFLEERIGDYGGGIGELVINDWLFEFQQAFGQPAGAPEDLITFENIVLAIAEYERSQTFVETPWKRFVQGDDSAIGLDAKKGALLFFRSIEDGGADCASCHTGDFFTDEEFHVVAVPQIGRGKGNGPEGNDDFGRMRETGDVDDLYAFRTPTLLNVEVTGPFGHSGAYTTLEGIVRHHLDPVATVAEYDFDQLDPSIQAFDMMTNTMLALDQLQANRDAGRPSLQDVDLSDEQVEQLIEFLRSLTDPCVKDRDCLSRWIPNAGTTNPDAVRLNAYDRYGHPF